MTAIDLAEAFRRVTSGDETPPRPWAHLSHMAIVWVGPTAYLEIAGHTDQAGFDLNTADGAQYQIMVKRVR